MAVLNLREFQFEVKSWASTQPKATVRAAMIKWGMQAVNSLVKKTPADIGDARGNWQTSTGATNENVLKRTEEQAISEGIEVVYGISRENPFVLLTVFNNSPYINVLDQGLFNPPNPGPSKDSRIERKGRIWVRNGFSVQAPNGMMDLTLQELRATLP